jgi:hypothetical protein
MMHLISWHKLESLRPESSLINSFTAYKYKLQDFSLEQEHYLRRSEV